MVERGQTRPRVLFAVDGYLYNGKAIDIQKVAYAAAYELLAPIAKPKQDFDKDAIIARMMIPMINEVVLCLEKGFFATPAEADIALV